MNRHITSAKQFLYDPCGLTFSVFNEEAESHEYGACTFNLNALVIKFRSAKITPSKTGQFVTLWKRSEAGITEPHDASDLIDLFVIQVTKGQLSGQFVFPKPVLVEKGILSSSVGEGKRGFRVYPPWDIATNCQAEITQKWQLDYFLKIPPDGSFDRERANVLFGLQ